MQSPKNYQQRSEKIFFILIILTFFAVNPFSVQAFSLDNFFEGLQDYFLKEGEFPPDNTGSQVINKVNVSAHTGGNKTEGETIEGGDAKVNIQVENIINGKSIDPIEIESEGNEVKVESKIEVEGDGKASVGREIEIDSQKTAENYEVDLESSANEEPTRTNLERIQSWWDNFLNSLMASLGNIFNIF